jgi:predicted NACHT family NTPase
MVDIAHEALIEGWPALQEWIRARRATELTRRRLEEKGEDWVRLGRGRGGLLDEMELPEAEAWLASADAQELGYDAALADLVQASRAAIQAARQREIEQARALAEEQRTRAEEQARAAARLRQRAVALAGMLLVACAAAVIAFLKNNQAQQEAVQARHSQATAVAAADARATQVVQTRQAETKALQAEAAAKLQAALATSSELIAETGRVVNDGGALDLALLLAVEAIRVDGTAEAQASLKQTLVANPPLEAYLHGHTSEVTSVAFSPDERILASGSADDTIRLWDVATHHQIGPPLTGHTSWVNSVAFSPDGKTLASGSCGQGDFLGICTQGDIRLWDVATHRQIGAPLPGHTSDVTSVAFSPDGKTLASGSDDHTIRLWDVATHQQISAPLTGHTDSVKSVAFSPDGKTLASGSHDTTIRLWDVSAHRQIGAPLPAFRGRCSGGMGCGRVRETGE